MEYHWWEVSIGLRDELVPSGNKTLPEFVLSRFMSLYGIISPQWVNSSYWWSTFQLNVPYPYKNRRNVKRKVATIFYCTIPIQKLEKCQAQSCYHFWWYNTWWRYVGHFKESSPIKKNWYLAKWRNFEKNMPDFVFNANSNDGMSWIL